MNLQDLIKKLEKHAKQNTYEGDEALVYRTTMKEVLDIANSNDH